MVEKPTSKITPESPFTLPGFFAAMDEGELLASSCESCGSLAIPPRPACYECGSQQVDTEEQPRTGHIISYTQVKTPAPAFESIAPFTIGIVELDSGARLTGRIDMEYEECHIDLPVKLTIQEPTEIEQRIAKPHEEEWPIHIFEPQ